MGDRFRRFLSFIFCNAGVITLAFLWFFGLLLGTVLAGSTGNSYFLLMRRAASSPVSITGLFASAFLPFLFSAFAVYLGKPKLLYFICFVKAVFFSFGTVCAYSAFGSAGWLVRFLLQFSDILMVPVLCWFSLRHISGAGTLKSDFAFCVFLFLLIGSLDYCIVSPFLAMLIDI